MLTDKRILVVDDDDAIRTLIATVLRRRGLAVDDARDGREALGRMVERPYALVVLDLMMPRMSGYDVLSHLGEQAESGRPLVLVLTAGAEPKPIDRSFVVATMHKPFDIELLVDTVVACVVGSACGKRDGTMTHSPAPNLPDEAN